MFSYTRCYAPAMLPILASSRPPMPCMCRQEEAFETWMLLEFCDRGALSRAIERGKLRSRAVANAPDLVCSPWEPAIRAVGASVLCSLFCRLLCLNAPNSDTVDGKARKPVLTLPPCRCMC